MAGFRWCFGALLVLVGGFRAGLLCVAGSGKFEKLLRSDLLAVVVGGGTALD